jgi:toxin FitB
VFSKGSRAAAAANWRHGSPARKDRGSSLRVLFAGRILPFDLKAAMEWARIMAEGTATGRPRSALDMVIAATAAANDCVVVTANERHFEGAVEFLNPLRAAG